MNAKLIVAILLFTVIALNSADVRAAGPVDVNAELGIFNKYIFRGRSVTDGPVVQPSVTLGLKSVRLNVWGNLELDDVNNKEYETTEARYSLEYTRKFVLMSAAVGATYYTFPVAYGADATTEIYISAKASVPGHPSLTIYQDVQERKGTYASLSASQGIPIGLLYSLEVSAALGWGSAKHNNLLYWQDGSALSDIQIGIGLPVGIGSLVKIKPCVIYTGILNSDISDTLDAVDIDDQNVVFGIIASAGF